MNHHKSQSTILWIQTAGGLGIIALSWLNQWMQLPAILFCGTRQQPNWRECAMETLVVAVMWAVTQPITRRLVRRLRYLEELMRVCAWCRKIHLEGRWMRLEEDLAQGLDLRTSHGMCPSCAEEQRAEMRKLTRAPLGKTPLDP
jgi:hypothetical protein